MTARALMLQGTGSGVGKSLLAAGLCRLFAQEGWRVAPFKSQNMALNSFVTREGGEMGRAQVVQAQAAGLEPHVDMNPILIKPEADSRSQIVVLGHPAFTVAAREYYQHTSQLLQVAAAALERLRSRYDLVVIEGAGSPAEINLRQREIVNMRIARLAQAPVLLVGDIDKGGVFASLVGTLVLLEPEERELVKGFIINKFRGDLSILQPGLAMLEERTGLPVLGVVPYDRTLMLPEEDSVYLEAVPPAAGDGLIDIAVIHFPRISNSTDFEPLQREPGVRLRYVSSLRELGDPNLIILPGTKSTLADLDFLRQSGLAQAIAAQAKGGARVLGICGGYQMLGERLEDPLRVESEAASAPGLGLLPVATRFEREKRTVQVQGLVAAEVGMLAGCRGLPVAGYEIHMGQSEGPSAPQSGAFRITQTSQGPADYPDGALSADGRILGTYIHGLFDSAPFRQAFLAALGRQPRRIGEDDAPRVAHSLEEGFDRLAALLRQHLDIERLKAVCGLAQGGPGRG